MLNRRTVLKNLVTSAIILTPKLFKDQSRVELRKDNLSNQNFAKDVGVTEKYMEVGTECWNYFD